MVRGREVEERVGALLDRAIAMKLWDGILVLHGGKRQSVLRCERQGGAAVSFSPEFIHGKLGMPDRTDRINEDELLRKLESWVID